MKYFLKLLMIAFSLFALINIGFSNEAVSSEKKQVGEHAAADDGNCDGKENEMQQAKADNSNNGSNEQDSTSV